MAVYYFKNKIFPKAKQGLNFEQEFNFPHENCVAFDQDGVFYAGGAANGGSLHSAKKIDVGSIEFESWLSNSFGDPDLVASTYVPGTVYKRIWRPLAITGSLHKAISQEKLNESFVSLRMLLAKLEDLFETIEPHADNLSVYGLKIREIILLACMEVESSWTAILKENNYQSQRLTTNDYVKLLTPLLLDGYELSLSAYPNFPKFQPFTGWSSSDPTRSLSWFDAYNKTKHDREEYLSLATLENAVYSVGAAVVMVHAQFGINFGLPPHDMKTPIIRNIFKVNISGSEKYTDRFYIPKIHTSADSREPQSSWEWQSIEYPF